MCECEEGVQGVNWLAMTDALLQMLESGWTRRGWDRRPLVSAQVPLKDMHAWKVFSNAAIRGWDGPTYPVLCKSQLEVAHGGLHG